MGTRIILLMLRPEGRTLIMKKEIFLENGKQTEHRSKEKSGPGQVAPQIQIPWMSEVPLGSLARDSPMPACRPLSPETNARSSSMAPLLKEQGWV